MSGTNYAWPLRFKHDRFSLMDNVGGWTSENEEGTQFGVKVAAYLWVCTKAVLVTTQSTWTHSESTEGTLKGRLNAGNWEGDSDLLLDDEEDGLDDNHMRFK